MLDGTSQSVADDAFGYSDTIKSSVQKDVNNFVNKYKSI